MPGQECFFVLSMRLFFFGCIRAVDIFSRAYKCTAFGSIFGEMLELSIFSIFPRQKLQHVVTVLNKQCFPLFQRIMVSRGQISKTFEILELECCLFGHVRFCHLGFSFMKLCNFDCWGTMKFRNLEFPNFEIWKLFWNFATLKFGKFETFRLFTFAILNLGSFDTQPPSHIAT